MNLKTIVVGLLIGVLWGQPLQANVSKEVITVSERAVGDAISSILAETIQESVLVKEEKARTLWFRPGYNQTEVEVNFVDGKANADLDSWQFLGGFLYQAKNWYLGVTGGYSYVEMDADIVISGDVDGFEARAELISLGPSVSNVIYRDDDLSIWGTFQGTWYRMEVKDIDLDDPGDTIDEDEQEVDIYDFGLSGHVMFELNNTLSILGNMGVSMTEIDLKGVEEAWAGKAGATLRYHSGRVRAKMSASLTYSFEEDESLVLELGPDLEWIFAGNCSIGLGYRYSVLLDQDMVAADEIDLDIQSHYISLNVRIPF